MPSEPNRPPRRILIVVNDIGLAEELRSRLVNLGYQVIGAAGTREEAMTVMATDRPDLVLMSIDLGGGLDGIQAAETIWSDFGVPAVFVTGCADLERLDRARLVLPFGYVLMPFQGADLRVTIERVLFVMGYQSLDIEGNFLEVNQAWLDTLGYGRDEVIGRNFSEFLHPDWRDHFRFNFPRFKAVGEVLGVEFEMVKKDGSVILVSFNGKIGRDERGGFRQTHCILNDITARREAEEEKRRLEAQLQQAQKMEAVGTLAGGIAHDFNNLLQIINGYAQILLFKKNQGEPGYRELSEIQKAGNRASQLIQQLLAFSHKAEISRKPVDLNREVVQAKEMLRRVIPKMIDIRLRLEDRPWIVEADPVQIEQALLNLGANAADAMPEGGSLLIETRNAALGQEDCRVLPDLTPGRYLLLTVTDTGHGMDPETLGRIFEPFFTTKEVGKGTGLGLASVYGIVKSHGGGIFCHSEPGRGASFKLYFPAVEETTWAKGDGCFNVMLRGGTECILLVDDEPSIRDFAGQALERFGYTVRHASKGEDALEIFRDTRNEIALVILDLGMPGMGGHKCLAEMLKWDPSARIVIASGYASGDRMQSAMNSGAAAYIAKPYRVAELLTTARKVLDKT